MAATARREPSFRVLGQIEVAAVAREALGGPKQRALLAYLLLRANELVPRDRLVDALWGDAPPPTAAKIVQMYVAKLRAALADTPARIVTRAPGYVLELDADELDLSRFERLARQGREALHAGDAERAAELLDEALVLWHGEALADLAYEPVAHAEAARLEQLRLEANIDRLDAALELGELPIADLESMVAKHPYEERLRGQLILALYRAGRQTDALAAYQAARRTLVADIGVEPGPALRQLEQAILEHDPMLETPHLRQAARLRNGLPKGTVTLLFTDIEGSTQLLHELGNECTEVLAAHQRLLRETFARHNGVEVDAQSDTLFMAFARASDAVAAAEEAQRVLEGDRVRVRIGLHTGEPVLTEDGYVGLDVHRGFRIASAAHGGQALLSQTTRDLVDAEVHDLGVHRLKDLEEPLHLFQLGMKEFPPLRSLSAANLPLAAEPLLGRQQEVDDVLHAFRHGEACLVTITGLGGIGKTRFALEVAGELVDEFPDGVWWIDLTPLQGPTLVVPAIAGIVGAREELIPHLRDRALLLVVDNFEHVIDAAPEISRLLRTCPKLSLLITSREPLRITGEREYRLPLLAEEPAVELFRQRLAANGGTSETDYRDLVEICCRRLDGLPLAIELAAAQARVLGTAHLAAHLDQRLPALTRGTRDAPERQRTLRATIDWSYALLEPTEKELFASLAVFAGSFMPDAAAEVCAAGLNDLAALVEKSLVSREGERLRMLATIREFAFERLGEGHDVRERYAAYYRRLVRDLSARIRGPDQYHVISVLDQEDDNVRAALAWLIEHEPRAALELALEMEPYWSDARDRLHETQRWLTEALHAVGGDAPEIRISALLDLGDAEWLVGERDRAHELFRGSLDLARSIGDRRGEANALLRLGRDDNVPNRFERALELYREEGYDRGVSSALRHLGEAAIEHGDVIRARASLKESLAIARGLQSPWTIVHVLHSCGDCELLLGELDRASAHYREGLGIAFRLGTEYQVAFSLGGLAAVAAVRGDKETASRLWGAVEQFEEKRGRKLLPEVRSRYERVIGTPDAAIRTSVDEAVRLVLASTDERRG